MSHTQGINLHIEDAETTGLVNDNESITSSELLLPWEVQRQNVTLMNLYPATRPS